jgi:hypothetical protein
MNRPPWTVVPSRLSPNARAGLGVGGLSMLLLAGVFLSRAPAADTSSAPASSGPKPAQVRNATPEAALATVTLTPAAQKRLGVTTVAIARRPAVRTRLYTGQVMLPLSPGQVATSLLPPQTPADFARVANEQALAEGAVGRARAQVQGARLELTRTERLLAEGVGTGRQIEQARMQLQVARADLAAAQQQRNLLGAPVSSAASGRTVWVRASIYVGDLGRLDRYATATLGGLDDSAQTPRRQARPVGGPPTADPGGATVNLYYAVDNADRALRLGQRVGLTLPLQGSAPSKLVIPWSAVVHDAYGGAWVYEQIGTRTYARRRVQVEAVMGTEAVLATGPAAGVRIVTNGVAEIFGTEFGNG